VERLVATMTAALIAVYDREGVDIERQGEYWLTGSLEVGLFGVK
jgi:hypothetical protein